MKQVTNPLTLGQLKRVSAILVDTIPQGEITKIMGNALTGGVLDQEIASFWRKLIIKFSPYGLPAVVPSGNFYAVRKLIDNIADFDDGEFIAHPEPRLKELVAIPFNSRYRMRDVCADILEAGCEPAYPEDLLGLILYRQASRHADRLSRLIVVGRSFNRGDGMCLMVLESCEGKVRLFRERVLEGGFIEGEYSVLAVRKST